MQLKMVGIDHSMAKIEYRELFAFTKDEAAKCMKDIVNDKVSECILISTCNRTELWVSGVDAGKVDLIELLCKIKNADCEKFAKYFVQRTGEEAIEHLMMTACGMNSRVFGEDQIITQIKEALDLGRKCSTTGTTLEKVFQSSITAAKKIKNSVKLTDYNPSVADSGIKKLHTALTTVQGMKCLIIGNGKMAALIAEKLVAEDADVTMTLRRRYHHGEEFNSIIPKGCKMIPYEDRYSIVEDADIVISATLSPHYTVTAEALKGIELKESAVWLDLAVPRDIEPAIATKFGITVWDIDGMEEDIDFSSLESEFEKARNIAEEHIAEIVKWLEFRRLVPMANEIVTLTKEDNIFRTEGQLKEINLSQDDTAQIQNIIGEATEKTVRKLIFGLKETMNEDLWASCMEALLEAAKKETMKS